MVNYINREDCISLVMREMCRRVDLPYESVDFKEPGWFMRNSWSVDEEKAFTNWLTEVLHKNQHVREGFTDHDINTKKDCRLLATSFVLTYGWTTNDEDDY